MSVEEADQRSLINSWLIIIIMSYTSPLFIYYFKAPENNPIAI